MVGAAFLILLAVAGMRPSGGGSDITLSAREVRAGETVTVAGTDCAPDSNVSISLDGSSLAETTASGQGSFRAPVTIPDATEPGEHTITAIGRDCGSSGTVTVLAVGTSDENSSWRIVAAVSIWIAGIVLAAAVVTAILRLDPVRGRRIDER